MTKAYCVVAQSQHGLIPMEFRKINAPAALAIAEMI
jgi:hypothetical protein